MNITEKIELTIFAISVFIVVSAVYIVLVIGLKRGGVLTGQLRCWLFIVIVIVFGLGLFINGHVLYEVWG